jgi:[ribosomal protein S5]-alanine N-acetyltransferase
VGLRPIRRRDAAAWREVRAANVGWLTPWEATPPAGAGSEVSFGQMVSFLRESDGCCPSS